MHFYGYQGIVSRISLQSCHIAYLIPFYLLTLKYSVCFYNSSYWPKSSVLLFITLFITLFIPVFCFLDSLGYSFCINLHRVVHHCPHTSEVKNLVPLSCWSRTGPDCFAPVGSSSWAGIEGKEGGARSMSFHFPTSLDSFLRFIFTDGAVTDVLVLKKFGRAASAHIEPEVCIEPGRNGLIDNASRNWVSSGSKGKFQQRNENSVRWNGELVLHRWILSNLTSNSVILTRE